MFRLSISPGFSRTPFTFIISWVSLQNMTCRQSSFLDLPSLKLRVMNLSDTFMVKEKEVLVLWNAVPCTPGKLFFLRSVPLDLECSEGKTPYRALSLADRNSH